MIKNKKGDMTTFLMLLGFAIIVVVVIIGTTFIFNVSKDNTSQNKFCKSINENYHYISSTKSCRVHPADCTQYYDNDLGVKCGGPIQISPGNYEFKTEYFPIEQFEEWKQNE